MIKICYSGSLDGFQPGPKGSKFLQLKKWFWTFKNNNVDSSTRSGYYFIKAIAELKRKDLIHPEDIKIEWWGKIDKINQMQIDQQGVSEFFTIDGYLPKQKSLERLANADVLFLPLEKTNSKNHRTLFIPGKLFEYLGTGKPILALCEDSDCKEILELSGLGICVSPDNVNEMTQIILRMLNDDNYLSDKKGNDDYIRQFSFEEKTKQLAEILNEFT